DHDVRRNFGGDRPVVGGIRPPPDAIAGTGIPTRHPATRHSIVHAAAFLDLLPGPGSDPAIVPVFAAPVSGSCARPVDHHASCNRLREPLPRAAGYLCGGAGVHSWRSNPT